MSASKILHNNARGWETMQAARVVFQLRKRTGDRSGEEGKEEREREREQNAGEACTRRKREKKVEMETEERRAGRGR